MNNTKVLSILNNLELQFSNLYAEVDSFTNGIIQWSSELPDVLKSELSINKSTLFAVPKTPRELKAGKKTRKISKKPKISQSSVLNSTGNQSETFCMNESISLRTRHATRAVSQVSQLNLTKDMVEVPLNYCQRATLLVEEKSTNDATDATFVVPKATTRTKPTHKNKKQDTTVPEVENPVQVEESNTELTDTLNQRNEMEIIEKHSRSVENISKTVNENSPELDISRKLSRTLSGSPSQGRVSKKGSLIVNGTMVLERPSRRKVSRSLSECQTKDRVSESPTLRSSNFVIPRSPSQSPVVRSNSNGSPVRRSSRNISRSILQNCEPSTPEFNSLANRTVTIKKESTPIADVEEMYPDDKTLSANGKTYCKTSTFVLENEKKNDERQETDASIETVGNADATVEMGSEEAEDVEVPKKKRKVKKKEEVKENIEDAGTVRITRTKSKALKKMMEETETEKEVETKQADLSGFAKKILNKAKMTSLKKSKLATIIETNSSTPANRPNLLFGNLTASKYHLLLSSSKKFKTPLATLPNSTIKSSKSSQDKGKIAKRDSSVENMVRSANKLPKDDQNEKEMKLKSKKEKEEEAALKRQNVIRSKQEELKKKNELKRQMAMKQRERLEQEKYQNMIQSEKEKEERHKLILQERQMKLKEEAFKKKMITMQKIAETTERRRLEEEARIARLKEQEAEEQRIALEKQKEEKRALERLAEKKAQEEYELQLKQELEAERLRAEKLATAKKCLPSASKTQSASKMQSASKRQKFAILGEKKDWDYKPRNENDYGLEHENSDSEEENNYNDSTPPIPWASRILNKKSPTVKVLTLEMLCEFLPCYQKSPDIHKMFKMTPSKRIKRSSSAIWNTPSS